MDKRIFILAVVFLVSNLILSIFAYLIIPDKSKYANQQFPEMALLDPGTKLQLRKIDEATTKMPTIMTFLMEGYGSKRLYNLEIERGQNTNTMTVWFGTDKYGRDIFSRVMLGIRYTLVISCMSVLLSIFLGILFGLLSGYYGGWLDRIISFLINIFWTLPTILLAFAILLAFGRNMSTLFFAIGLTLWSDVARMVRGQVFTVKELGYIRAAKALGLEEWRTMLFHILPNILNPVWVLAASNFALAVLLESGLSFLGFGLQPPIPTLGNILQEQYIYALSGKPFLGLIPCIVVVLLILSFQIITNYIREGSDVKQAVRK